MFLGLHFHNFSLGSKAQTESKVTKRIHNKINKERGRGGATMFLYYIIFYVAMKQPRSTSHTNTKLHKKALLPSFKQPKVQSKVQELSAASKAELYIHAKLIPLEITAERKTGETIKITVNSNDLVVQDLGKTYKSTLSIPSAADLNTVREWVEVDLGEVCSNIKVRKIGDQNSIGPVSSMVSWDKMETGEKKVGATVSLKDIIRGSQRTMEGSTSATLPSKQDKNKQMKAFVANLMSRKIAKRASEINEPEPRVSMKKRSEIFRNKLAGGQQELNKNSFIIKMNPPSTAGSVLSGISGVRSFRKDLNQKNNLKQSKFTGKSQKETSIGDHSLFMNNKTNTNIATHLSSLEEEYDKKKQKFDSQPYFYQKSTITSNFSNNNHNESLKKCNNLSRQEQCSIENNKVNTLRVPEPEAEKKQDLGECLKDKSQHESEEEVEEDIKRSAMMDSSLRQQDSQLKKGKKTKKVEESSQCFESKEIESSGTIYESKYQ